MRLICRNDHVEEESEAAIHFVFDSTGLEAGDVVKGDIQVVSNAGEYYLPFVFSVSYGIVRSSMGNVRNLFHFTNQAQINWDEAVDLFYSPEFARVFGGNDRIHYDKFRGLSNNHGDPQAVDDFLVAINKKRPVTFSVDRLNLEYNDVSDNVESEFLLHKSTWGNIDAHLTTDSAFIRLDKERLEAGDFIGNDHLVKFTIIGDSLHEGKNFATITIKSANSELNINIVARHRANINAKRASRREKKNLTKEQVNPYLDSVGSSAITDSKKIAELATRPEVELKELLKIVPRGTYSKEEIESVEISIRYRGYIERELAMAEKLQRLEDLVIPDDFDFDRVSGLTIECRQKLAKYRPRTIAQASRISGVSPADISVLLVCFGR
jgi:hypothetical protein